jgi:hypothetical protein
VVTAAVNLIRRCLAAGTLCAALAAAAAAQAPPPARVVLAPRFSPGQVLRYQTEFRVASETHVTGAVESPQGPTQIEVSLGTTVRMEVLNPPLAPPLCPRCSRIRVTYEKVAATTMADVRTPELGEREAQLKRLEGRSLEFTLAPDGKVTDLAGPEEDFLPADKKTLEDSLAQLSWSPGAPPEGVVPGQKWTTERAITPAPLLGLVWRSESTFLRVESCQATAPAAGPIPAAAGETCAVILTQFSITQRPAGSDATPPEFRARALRTAGKLAGSGDSLVYVSLKTGWVVSVTEQASEETDLIVTAVEDNSQTRYASRVRRQSSMTLLPAAPPN